jgi:hypothetical protein
VHAVVQASAEKMLRPMRESVQAAARMTTGPDLSAIFAKTTRRIFQSVLSARKSMSRLWAAVSWRRKDEDPGVTGPQELVFDETANSARAGLITHRRYRLVVFWHTQDYLLSTRMPCGPTGLRTSLVMSASGAALS